MVAAQANAESATTAKLSTRANHEACIRRLVQKMKTLAAVSDEELQAMGLPLDDPVITPVEPPTTRPVLIADTRQRLQVSINFADEGTPTSIAKPPGVMGCEISMKLGGAAPAGLEDCELLALDTRTPYVVVFEGGEANQTAHFIGRWQNTRGEKGPLSATVSATVTA